MNEYEHLLLAVDFAVETEQVVERAVQLRNGSGARLSLVHVVEYLPMSYTGDLALPEDFSLEEELVEVAGKRMQALGERLGVAEEDRHVEVGSTSREILRLAQQCGADLIVLGSHGRYGIAMLLGSTANAVLHHAKCDVLAVRIREG